MIAITSLRLMGAMPPTGAIIALVDGDEHATAWCAGPDLAAGRWRTDTPPPIPAWQPADAWIAQPDHPIHLALTAHISHDALASHLYAQALAHLEHSVAPLYDGASVTFDAGVFRIDARSATPRAASTPRPRPRTRAARVDVWI